MDASHRDTHTAYAAVNTIRLDDLRPHLFAPTTAAATWTEIVDGLPDGAVSTWSSEDPVRSGLLFAGTESRCTSRRRRRALAVAAAQHARDVHPRPGHQGRRPGGGHPRARVLDPGRHHAAAADDAATRRAPPASSARRRLRVRWNRCTDTPLPPDEPAGQNPPDGAILDYWLGRPPGPVTLEILDAAGAAGPPLRQRRRPVPPLEGQQRARRTGCGRCSALSAGAGHAPLRLGPALRDAPGRPAGLSHLGHRRLHAARAARPIAMPGDYTVRLTADGHAYTMGLHVDMDPRVATPLSALQTQFELSLRIKDVLDRRGPNIRRACVRRCPNWRRSIGSFRAATRLRAWA